MFIISSLFNIKKIKNHIEYFIQIVTVTVTTVLMVIFTMF